MEEIGRSQKIFRRQKKQQTWLMSQMKENGADQSVQEDFLDFLSV